MATFQNIETKITVGENATPMTYADLLKVCLGAASSEGITIGDMRNRIKILDKLENPGKTMELTTEEVLLVKGVVANFKWAVMHKDLIGFGEHIESL